MRYFIDTEFSEHGYGKPIEIISIGMVAEDGRELYLCNHDFDPASANEWVRTNVLPLLPKCVPGCIPWGRTEGAPLDHEAIAWNNCDTLGDRIREFIGDDPTPEFWGYYCAFDYVLLSQLMGGMAEWPQGWPYMMHDLRQWLDHEAMHHVSQPDDAPHDAIQDARWIRDTFLEYRDDRWQWEATL